MKTDLQSNMIIQYVVLIAWIELFETGTVFLLLNFHDILSSDKTNFVAKHLYII